jgi:hypothetical protein
MRKINPKKAADDDDDEERTYILPSVRIFPPAAIDLKDLSWVVAIEYDS